MSNGLITPEGRCPGEEEIGPKVVSQNSKDRISPLNLLGVEVFFPKIAIPVTPFGSNVLDLGKLTQVRAVIRQNRIKAGLAEDDLRQAVLTDSPQTVRNIDGQLLESGEDYIIVGEKPLKAPKINNSSLRSRCLQFAEAAFVVAVSILSSGVDFDQKSAQAKESNLGDPTSKKPLEAKGGMLSEQIITSYTVVDLQLIGRDRLATLINLGDLGQYIASGGLKDGELALAKKLTKLPFLGTAVIASDDGSIMGALGSTGPGMNEGKLGLYENGGISVYNNGKGSILDGTVTPDKTGIIVRAGNISAGETEYLYQYFDLATRTFRTFNLCGGCLPGGVGGPLVSVSADTSSSYGTGFPYPGYMETVFNRTTLTASTTQRHSEEGHNMSKRLNHYYNSINEHIIWMVNNDTSDPENTYQWATLIHNTDNVRDFAKDVRPNITGYPEINAGGGTSGIGIAAAVADLSGGRGYMSTAFLPRASVIRYPHIETFSLDKPGDLNQRFLVPEDGDSPPAWPNGGMRGDPGRFVTVLTQGTERYLLRDVRVNQTAYNGLLLRRITNGITSSDQWIKVTIAGGYALYLPKVMQPAN
ncbi:hypothetical protein HYU95_02625 [Candidatus Daviesbacteria bacterium]|nr:hypothetical protein [Candidatus Daviesbacteria bacterium]